MKSKRALVTGITGQDGSYLAELLLEKGYEVYGLVRRSSSVEKTRIEHLYKEPHQSKTRLFLEYGDLSDGSSLRRLLTQIKPDEIYNLAAQSHVRISFDQPEYTADVVGMGVMRLLEAMRDYIITGRCAGAVLPGFVLGNVRRHAAAAERTDFFSSAESVCRGEGGGFLAYGELPGSLWNALQ